MKMTLLLSLCLLLANVSASAQANRPNPYLAKVVFGKFENVSGEVQKQVNDVVLLAKAQGISWIGAPNLSGVFCNTVGSKDFCYTTILFWHDNQDQLDTFVNAIPQFDSIEAVVSNKTGNFMSLIYGIETKSGGLIDCDSKIRTSFSGWIDGYMTLNMKAASQSKLSLVDLEKIISSTTNCTNLNLSDIKTIHIQAELTNREICEFNLEGIKTCFLTKGFFSHAVNY
jgi:hypothetical protein